MPSKFLDAGLGKSRVRRAQSQIMGGIELLPPHCSIWMYVIDPFTDWAGEHPFWGVSAIVIRPYLGGYCSVRVSAMGRLPSLLGATGYDQEVIPDRYAAVPRCEKPVTAPRLKQALARNFGL